MHTQFLLQVNHQHTLLDMIDIFIFFLATRICLRHPNSIIQSFTHTITCTVAFHNDIYSYTHTLGSLFLFGQVSGLDPLLGYTSGDE